MARVIWRPPRLRTLETNERGATWTELFYDLVFVVAVSRLGARLAEDLTTGGFLEFVALFAILWWGWASFAFFADRYDTDDSAQRLLAVAQMIGVAGMAAAIGLGDQQLDTISREFAASYTVVRVVLMLMYLRAWYYVPDTRRLVGGYLKGFVVEVVLWGASVIVPVPLRYVLWAVGVLVSLATPWLVRRAQAAVPLSVSHLPERFGLFTILVLGESIAAVVVGVEHEEWADASALAGVSGVLMTTSLWWVYFDNFEGAVVRRDPSKRHDWRPTAWIYSHLPLAIALTMAGIGLEELVVAAPTHELEASSRWLSVAGVAGAYLSMAMILASSTPADVTLHFSRKTVLRLGAAAFVVVLGLVGGGLRPAAFAVALSAVCALQVALDVAERWYSVRVAVSASRNDVGAPASDTNRT